MTRFVCGNADCRDRGASVNAVGERYGICSRVEVVGKIAGYTSDRNITETVSVKDHPCRLFRGESAAAEYTAVFCVGRFDLYLSDKGKDDHRENEYDICPVKVHYIYSAFS